MKAKSKVLLGLLVALAMMVMAVPAFASTAGTVTVSGPTPSTGLTAYVGDEKATFTFDITETDAKTGDVYAVTFSDDVGTGASAPHPFATTGENTVTASAVTLDSAGKATVTVTIPGANFTATSGSSTIGDHNLKYTVTKTASDGSVTNVTGTDQVCKVTVKALPTATLSAKTATVNVGQAIGLTAAAGDTTAETVTYNWQISDKTDDATKADSNKWTDMGATDPTLSTAATADMDGKYVRCVVTVDGKAVVAGITDGGDTQYYATLTVTDTAKVTVKAYEGTSVDSTKEAKSAYAYFVGSKDDAKFTANATGGPSGISEAYQWYKDGEKIDSAKTDTLTLADSSKAVTKDIAGVYKCVATKGSLTGETANITVTVKDTPTLKIAEADGDAAKYTQPSKTTSTATAGTGNIRVEKADMENELTLTAEVGELTPAWYKWYTVSGGTETEISSAANKNSYTIPAGELEAGAQYRVRVGFDKASEGLADASNFNYTATIKTVDGSLTGGIVTSTDGAANLSYNPTVTITLPEGLNFKTVTEGSPTGLAKYAVAISVADTDATALTSLVNEIGDSEVKVTPATATTPAKLTFNHKKLGTAVSAPVVGPMAVTVTANDGINDVEVNLPIDETVGYNVTLAAKGYEVASTYTQNQLNLVGSTSGKLTKTYTGEAVEAEIEAKTGVLGLGEISKVRYLKTTAESTPPTNAEIATAVETAPSDVGSYFVICDIEDGEQWAGSKDQVGGLIKITQASTPTAEMFVMDPEKVEYNGKEQKTEVSFAEGVTKAGVIDKITYKQGNSIVTPKNVGKYDVYVTTKSEETGDDENVNVYSTAPGVKVGVFEITKVMPTADLYTMEPTEVKYNGAGQEPVITPAEGAAKYSKAIYYKDGAEEPIEGKPTEAGVYTVKIETEENDTYAAATGEDALELGTFTIKPEQSEQPDIFLNAHVENQGWDAKNTELEVGDAVDVGTTGLGRRVEAVAIMVPEDYEVIGFAHVQNEGDVDVKPVDSSKDYDIPEGYVAYEFGSTGKGQRVEAICIGIQDAEGKYVDGFQYATHLQNYGWQGYVRNGSFSGTRGMALRMESIRFTYADPDVVKPGEPSGSLLQ